MKKNYVAIALTVLMILGIFVSCTSPEQKIVGTWKSDSSAVLGVKVESVYVFNEDGTGTMSALLGVEVPIKYSFSDDKLVVTTVILGNDAATTEYDYKFSGNNLVLSIGGESVTYTRAA
ncbi:MAG: hypothetical protein E7588_07990 [Ruminococcaceae bacterium]|nr:hypothetical protein [Oscillospiraceae bacterium]